MRAIQISVVILLMCSPALPQQGRQTATVSLAPSAPVVPHEPQSCVEFDQMAARVNAVTTMEEITTEEFATAATQPGVVTLNPGKVFDVGNAEYVATEENGKPTFNKFTTHKDKKTEFLKWYGANNRVKMMTTGLSCLTASNAADMAVKLSEVILAISQADTISEDGFRDTIGALINFSNAQTEEIFRLKDRYNKLVENVNGYNEAVNNLISTVGGILKTQRTSRPMPAFNFNFVRPQPITCTGNTLAYSNSTAYLANVDTMTSATTTIHCQ